MKRFHCFLVSVCSLVTFFLIFLGCGEVVPATRGGELVEAVREQIGVTTIYDAAYVGLKYPGGDVPVERGVCTDVVVRGMRKMGFDLQKLVHEDMKKAFSKYPKIWGLKRPDPNIDHRRVPNLRRYFERRGISLAVSGEGKNFQAGDFVTCTLPGNLPHIMIVSERKGASGNPMIIHNIGSGTKEEDGLFRYPINGHYRWFALAE